MYVLKTKLAAGNRHLEVTPPLTGDNDGPGFTIYEAVTPSSANCLDQSSQNKITEDYSSLGGQVKTRHETSIQDTGYGSTRAIPSLRVFGPESQEHKLNSSPNDCRPIPCLPSAQLTDSPYNRRSNSMISDYDDCNAHRPELALFSTQRNKKTPDKTTLRPTTAYAAANSFPEASRGNLPSSTWSASSPKPGFRMDPTYQDTHPDTTNYYDLTEENLDQVQPDQAHVSSDDDTCSNASTESMPRSNQENHPNDGACNLSEQENLSPEFADRAGPLRELASKAERDYWKPSWHLHGRPDTLNDFALQMRVTSRGSPVATRRKRTLVPPSKALERGAQSSPSTSVGAEACGKRSFSDGALHAAARGRAGKMKRHSDGDTASYDDSLDANRGSKKLFIRPPGTSAGQSVRRSSRLQTSAGPFGRSY